ncbi:MAG: copper ion binding protein [Acidimicrobiales bacterium]|nr:copper ion binding protein [Acidimicrobiales bacterium]
MSTSTFTVGGMTCDHCVSSVTEAVGKIDGVDSVDVELESGLVTLESDTEIEIDTDAFTAAIERAGYEVTS